MVVGWQCVRLDGSLPDMTASVYVSCLAAPPAAALCLSIVVGVDRLTDTRLLCTQSVGVCCRLMRKNNIKYIVGKPPISGVVGGGGSNTCKDAVGCEHGSEVDTTVHSKREPKHSKQLSRYREARSVFGSAWCEA